MGEDIDRHIANSIGKYGMDIKDLTKKDRWVSNGYTYFTAEYLPKNDEEALAIATQRLNDEQT